MCLNISCCQNTLICVLSCLDVSVLFNLMLFCKTCCFESCIAVCKHTHSGNLLKGVPGWSVRKGERRKVFWNGWYQCSELMCSGCRGAEWILCAWWVTKRLTLWAWKDKCSVYAAVEWRPFKRTFCKHRLGYKSAHLGGMYWSVCVNRDGCADAKMYC